MSEVLPFECSYEHACRIEPDYECANTNCELNPINGEIPMSDCSTEAMKPKTCLNCKHDETAFTDGGCEHYRTYGDYDCFVPKTLTPLENMSIPSMREDDCKKRLQVMEQRHQQLEQLSLDALAYLKRIGQVHLYLMYREQLEALGVSLND